MATIADAFFYQELQATLGKTQASDWLASRQLAEQPAVLRLSSSSSQGDVTYDVSEAVEYLRCLATCPASLSRERSDDLDMSELASKLGVHVGLIYTDAAHTMLD